MIRDVDILDISDGRLYGSDDLVKLGSGGCAGCSRCCREVGNTIVLDPYDVFRLGQSGGFSFDTLLQGYIQLSVVDSLVLPHLSMTEGENAACVFLNPEGRCSIHTFRPGYCRLYPLGRYYDGNEFSYILQVHECDRAKTKVRIRKWLEEPHLPLYEQFVRDWHRLTRDLMHLVDSSPDELRQRICVQLLNDFYRRSWDYSQSFFPQFDAVLEEERRKFSLAP